MMNQVEGAPLNNNDGTNQMASPAPANTMNRFFTPSPKDRKQEHSIGEIRTDRDFFRRGRRSSANRPRTTMFPDDVCEGHLTIPSPTAKPTRAVSYEPTDLGLPLFFLSPAKKENLQETNGAAAIFDNSLEGGLFTPIKRAATSSRLHPRPQEPSSDERFCEYGEGECRLVPPHSALPPPLPLSGIFETPENQLEPKITSPPPNAPVRRPFYDLKTKLVRVQSAPLYRSNYLSYEQSPSTDAVSNTLQMRQNLSTNPFYTGDEESSEKEGFEVLLPKKAKSWYPRSEDESPLSTAAKLTFE